LEQVEVLRKLGLLFTYTEDNKMQACVVKICAKVFETTIGFYESSGCFFEAIPSEETYTNCSVMVQNEEKLFVIPEIQDLVL
jgi:hypothetical protein